VPGRLSYIIAECVYASTSSKPPLMLWAIVSQFSEFRGYSTSTRSTSNPTGRLEVNLGLNIELCKEELKITAYISSSHRLGYLPEFGSFAGCFVRLNCNSSGTSSSSYVTVLYAHSPMYSSSPG